MCVRANVRVWEGRRDAQLLSPQAAWGASEPGRRRRCGSRQLDTGRQTDGKGFGGWRRGGAGWQTHSLPPEVPPTGCAHAPSAAARAPQHPTPATPPCTDPPPTQSPKRARCWLLSFTCAAPTGLHSCLGMPLTFQTTTTQPHQLHAAPCRRSGAGSSSISAWRSQRWPLRAEFLNGSAVHKPCSLIHNFHRTRTHRFINPPL